MTRICAFGSFVTKSFPGGLCGMTFLFLCLMSAWCQAQANSKKSRLAQDPAPTPLENNPIVITSGGTYSGTWSSNDPAIPVVTILTDDLVILQNSVITGKGDLIRLQGVSTGANVIVENVTGTAVDPGIAGLGRGKFINAYFFNSLTVQNCSMYGVSFGVYAAGASPSTLSITNNLGSHLEDRVSDGLGGLLSTRIGMGHFIILNHVNAPNGAEIGWNQLAQTMWEDSTADVINIYESQGAPGSPILVHDNYIEGNWSPTVNGQAYTGTAIMTDGDGSPLAAPTAYVSFVGNQIVQTGGAGIAIAYGHDVTAENNRVVSCGMTSEKNAYGYLGNWYSWGAGAATIWNYYGTPNFYNNTIRGTFGGMLGPPQSKNMPQVSDAWMNPADQADPSNAITDSNFTDPCLSGKKVDLTAEDTERSFWASKVVAAGQLIGDQHLPTH